MRDVPRTDESPEQDVTGPTESKIETFDDLKTTDQSRQIETFDDLKSADNQEGVETFDDLKTTDQPDRIEAVEDSDKPQQNIEQDRLDQAATNIEKADWLQQEKWETLSTNEKRIALDREAGIALSDAYDQPKPPIMTDKADPNALGLYGDGYSSDPSTGEIIGSDYGIRMNEDGMNERDEKLFGDDPKAALETYSHEFRHSYQAEQAGRFEKGFKTDNPEQAREWSENNKGDNYRRPPDSELAKTDPEKYFQEYEAYRNQPVERDARDFASQLTDRVYGPDEDVES